VFNLTLLVRINDYSDLLVASKNSRYILYYYSLVCVLNIVLNYFLIKYFSAIGAAISTVLCISILAILQLRKSIKLTQKHLTSFFDFKRIVVLLLLLFLVSFTLNTVLSYLNSEILKLALFFIFYFPLTYFTIYKLKYFSNEVISELKVFKRFY
jgi:O-antigen/teichoic acid export membrane protein